MERVPCEFSLIRYVPDVVKGEFVNIGVLLREAGREETRGGGRVAVRFTRDWRRVRCVDADADIGLLEGMETEFRGRLERGTSATDPKGLLEVLEDTLSNSVQVSEGRATLAEDLAAEMELLMRMYVEPMRVGRARDKVRSGRAALLAEMRRAFESVGAWGIMDKRVPASRYTQPGDTLRIDCMYRAREVQPAALRMFQAVSLEGEVEAAKGLAFSAAYLRAGAREGRDGEKSELELTAVVEPVRSLGNPDEEGDEAVERYDFAVRMMEHEGIRVLPVSQLEGAARTAKLALRL